MEISQRDSSPYWLSFSTTSRLDTSIYYPESHPILPTAFSINVHPSLRERHSSVRFIIATTVDEDPQDSIRISEPPSLASSFKSSSQSLDNSTPLTIVMQLKTCPSDQYFLNSLFFELEPKPAPSAFKTSPRIIFDKNLPLQAGLECGLSHIVVLRSSGRFISYIKVPGWRRHLAVSEYQISILPTRRDSQVSFDKLPRMVLLDIANRLWEERSNVRNSKNILSMALVCTAWKCALEAYFRKVGTSGYYIHDPRALVESLNFQPEMARYITAFHYKYHEAPPEEFKDLISVSRSLCDLEIPRELYYQCRTTLSNRTNIKKFRVLDYTSTLDSDGNVLPDIIEADSLPELYDLVKRWEQLEVLEISVSDLTKQRILESPVISSPFSLQELSFTGYKSPTNLDMKHLRLFLGLTPTLHTLKLVCIGGISNTEIRRLLMSLSQTLKQLTILSCRLEMEADGEEHAIDAAMPHLQKLDFLEADYPTAGVAVVSRKPPCTKHINKTCCSLLWRIVDYRDYEEIARAIEVSGWATIVLSQDVGMVPSQEQWTLLQGAATRRGILLNLEAQSYRF